MTDTATATATPTSSVQLRVLAGLHEGAVLALAADAGAVRLAAGGKTDVLLRDAPGEALLQSGDDGAWHWREPGFEQAIAVGQAWRWGTLVLALADARQPWPEEGLPALVFDRAVVSPAPAATPEAAEPSVPAAAAEAADVAETPAAADPAAAPRRGVRTRSGARLRVALVGIVGALLLVFALLFVLLGQTPAPASDVPVSLAVEAAPVNLSNINKAIAQLELTGLVRAKLRDDGRLLLSGVVPDEAQLDALLRAVSLQTRRASPRVITQAEFVARARGLQANLPEGIEAMAEDAGRLVLMGSNADVNWVLARQLVDSELPEVLSVEHRTAGTPEVMREWRDTRATVQAQRQAAPAAAPAPPPVVFPPLPEIAAVVGGARPFVVLLNGDKWLPGGQFGGVTLRAVEDQALVFDDAQGNTLRRPR